MQLAKPIFATHPFQFGRARSRGMIGVVEKGTKLTDDLRLFAATFLAGFVFVSILIC
jgi:hypothetical protein